jgi:hypothetical protein
MVEVSDAHTEGGGKDKIIDNDYGTGGYWHSMLQILSPDVISNSSCPIRTNKFT